MNKFKIRINIRSRSRRTVSARPHDVAPSPFKNTFPHIIYCPPLLFNLNSFMKLILATIKTIRNNIFNFCFSGISICLIMNLRITSIINSAILLFFICWFLILCSYLKQYTRIRYLFIIIKFYYSIIGVINLILLKASILRFDNLIIL